MCFFFAQKYHTSMKYVGAIRKELGFRTVFNILGPLTNPGTPSMQLYDTEEEYKQRRLYDLLLQILIRYKKQLFDVLKGKDLKTYEVDKSNH